MSLIGFIIDNMNGGDEVTLFVRTPMMHPSSGLRMAPIVARSSTRTTTNVTKAATPYNYIELPAHYNIT